MRRAFLLGVFALAAAVSGCGGGGDDRLSREEYITQADEICTDYDRRLDELPDPQNVEDLQRLVDEGLPIAREGIEKLKALRPPEELEARVNEWHERNDENLQKIEELGRAAESGDEQRVQTLAAEASRNEAEADRIAQDIGLQACGEEG